MIPGLTAPNWFNGQVRAELTQDSRALLPDAEAVERLKKVFWSKEGPRFVYVKLHGSYGWESHLGSDMLVIGHAKSKTIAGEPLLRWYFSLFEDVLHERGTKLLVMGYGFGDAHINEVIADSIRDYGLKLYIVSPEQPAERRAHLMPPARRDTSALRGADIWKGLAGYFRASAAELSGKGTRTLPPEGRALFMRLEQG